MTCIKEYSRYDGPMDALSVNPLIAACAIALVSTSGVLFTVGRFGRSVRDNLALLVSFATGVFVVVTSHLLIETYHEQGVMVALLTTAGGGALMYLLTVFLSVHHHHSTSHEHSHSHIDGRRVLVSDALHNIVDGFIVVAAFAASSIVGVVTTIGILVHEFVQETAEFFVLREAGYTTRRALMLNALAASTVLWGVLLASFLQEWEFIGAILGGLAAGSFLTVLLLDLMPHTGRYLASPERSKHFIAVLAGIMLMMGLQELFPHSEEHGDETRAATAAFNQHV